MSMKKLLMGLIKVPSEFKSDEDVYKAFEKEKGTIDKLWSVLQRYAKNDPDLLKDPVVGGALIVVEGKSLEVRDPVQLLNLAKAFEKGRPALKIEAGKDSRAALLALHCYYQTKSNNKDSVVLSLNAISSYLGFMPGELKTLIKERMKEVSGLTQTSSSAPADSKANNATSSNSSSAANSVPTTPKNPTGNSTPPASSSSSTVTTKPTVSTTPSVLPSTHLSMSPPPTATTTSTTVPSTQPVTTSSTSSPAPISVTAPVVNKDKKQDDDSPLGLQFHAAVDEDASKEKEKEKEKEKKIEVEKPKEKEKEKITATTAAPTIKPPVNTTVNPVPSSSSVSTTTTAAPSTSTIKPPVSTTANPVSSNLSVSATTTAAPSASTIKPPVSTTANPVSSNPSVSTTTTAASSTSAIKPPVSTTMAAGNTVVMSSASSSSTSGESAANTKSKKEADALLKTTLDQFLINLVTKGFTYSGVELFSLLSRSGGANKDDSLISALVEKARSDARGLGKIIGDFESGKYKDDANIANAFEVKSYQVQAKLVKSLIIKNLNHLINLAAIFKTGDITRNINANNDKYAICLGLVCYSQDKQAGQAVSVDNLKLMFNVVSSQSVKKAISDRIEQRNQEIAAAQKPAETKDNNKGPEVPLVSSSSASASVSSSSSSASNKQQPTSGSSVGAGQSSPPVPLPVAQAVIRPLKTANYRWLYFKQEVGSIFKHGWGVLKAAWACIRNRSTADFEQRMEALRMRIASEAVLVKIQMKPDEFSALKAFSRAMLNNPKLENEIAIKPPMLVQPGKRPQDELTLIVDVARAARIQFFSDKKASNPTTPLTDAEIARLRALKEDSVKLAVKLK